MARLTRSRLTGRGASDIRPGGIRQPPIRSGWRFDAELAQTGRDLGTTPAWTDAELDEFTAEAFGQTPTR